MIQQGRKAQMTVECGCIYIFVAVEDVENVRFAKSPKQFFHKLQQGIRGSHQQHTSEIYFKFYIFNKKAPHRTLNGLSAA